MLVGSSKGDEREAIRNFLMSFDIVRVNIDVAEAAIAIRIKLPDSIALATAQAQDALMITRDIKAFSQEIPIVRVPYTCA